MWFKGQAVLSEIYVNTGGVNSCRWPTVTPSSHKCSSRALTCPAPWWLKLKWCLKGKGISAPPLPRSPAPSRCCCTFPLCCHQPSILRLGCYIREGKRAGLQEVCWIFQLRCHGHWIRVMLRCCWAQWILSKCLLTTFRDFCQAVCAVSNMCSY